MSCSSHTRWLHHFNYICRWIQVVKLIIMWFFSNSLLLQTSLVKIFSSAPCFPIPKASVLHVTSETNFYVLDSRWEVKSFWTKQYQELLKFNLFLTSPGIELQSFRNIWNPPHFETISIIFVTWFSLHPDDETATYSILSFSTFTFRSSSLLTPIRAALFFSIVIILSSNRYTTSNWTRI